MKQYCMYLRKSRADAEAEARGEGETLARHEHALQELAKRQHLPIVKVYREIVSGDSIAARPQMQQLLQDLEQNRYEGVLVMEVERLARGNTIDQGIVAQAFKDSETKIITPVKTYDPNNEFDEEYFEFSLFMSRREYKTIKRRMQAGRIASIKEGNYIGTNPPYGYRKIHPAPKVRTLEIVEEEANVIRMIFDDYLHHGKGAKAIATKLNLLQIPPQKADRWECVSVRKILKNPIYAGKILWHTKKDGDILAEGHHEGIISYESFCEVQKRMKKKAVPQTQVGTELKNYYHDVMFCGNCGKPLNEGALFCPECGTPVKKIETENVNVEKTTASQAQPNNIPIRNYDPRFDYTPLGAWSYFLYTLLFSIPIIGFIFAIVFAVGGTNRINLRNYARSYFCWLLITVVLVIILLIVGFAIAGTVYNIFDHPGYYHYYM